MSSPALQTGPEVRLEGANRCARVQGNMLERMTQNRFVASQMAAALEKTFFPSG